MSVYRNIQVIVVVFFIVLCTAFKSQNSPVKNMGVLIVNLSNIDTPSGRVRVGLYNRDNFLTKNYIIARSVGISSRSNVSVTFNDLPYGEYAVAVYHDINDNKSLDKTAIGIPNEPYAFSNNYKVYMRPPSYDEVKINFQQGLTLDLKLLRWW